MKKLPKEILILSGAAILVCALLVIVSIISKSPDKKPDGDTASAVTETTTEPIADVEPIELPDKSPIAQVLGFEPMQVEKLSDKYVLRDVIIEDNGVNYSYQMHLAANGRRLFLKINKMTQEEYDASLPAEVVREPVTVDGREAVFANRTLYKVPKDQELTEDSIEIKQEKEGTAVIERTDLYKELSQIQTLDWYENGCKYEIYADYMSFTLEDITELAHNYFENGQYRLI